MDITLPRLLIAAPESGSGKTTLTAGLIGALRRRGLTIQPFKCGPDYIDPGYHALAAGRSCRNLDSWLLAPGQVRDLFSRACAGADMAVIEGVMGLFDGFGALDDSGSSADIARLLGAPVLLAIDARGMARSAAALVDGFRRFDERVRIAGVLLNRVGGPRHAEICATAITAHTGLPCFGYLPRRAEFQLPERHLGLMTTAEDGPWAEVIARVADTLAETCDLDGLLALARSASETRGDELETRRGEQDTDPTPTPTPTPAHPLTRSPAHPLIAVARDAAFSFTYPETYELLEAAGARVVAFSPIADTALPPETRGVILSGGFPELYPQALSRNSALHAELRAAHAAGMPIYAECGGLMYLTELLIDLQGQGWPMVGLLPGRSVMTDRLTLGYRTARARCDGPLLPAGAAIRGHEFHYSRWDDRPSTIAPAYTVLAPSGEDGLPEGAQVGGLIASYIHLHWLARPEIARQFVRYCLDVARMHARASSKSGTRPDSCIE